MSTRAAFSENPRVIGMSYYAAVKYAAIQLENLTDALNKYLSINNVNKLRIERRGDSFTDKRLFSG